MINKYSRKRVRYDVCFEKSSNFNNFRLEIYHKLVESHQHTYFCSRSSKEEVLEVIKSTQHARS